MSRWSFLGARRTTLWSLAVVTVLATLLSSTGASAKGSGGGQGCNKSKPCDTTPPAVAISVPSPGTLATGVITVAGTASDNRTVAKVTVTVDGTSPQLATGTTIWTDAVDTTAYADGVHTIAAMATDSAGNVGTTSLSVDLSNPIVPDSSPSPSPSPSLSPSPSPSPSSSPSPQESLIFQTLCCKDHQNPVEQQSPDFFSGANLDPASWVWNPTGCVWDVDDNQPRWAVDQYLDPGAVAQDGLCVIADWAGAQFGPFHVVKVSVFSPSADLTISVNVSPGFTLTASPVWDAVNRTYNYAASAHIPSYQPYDALVQAIPDSNGGWGVPTTATLTITNVGKRAKVTAYWGIENAWYAGEL